LDIHPQQRASLHCIVFARNFVVAGEQLASLWVLLDQYPTMLVRKASQESVQLQMEIEKVMKTQLSGSSSSLLLIMDRGMDLQTPLMHDLAFQVRKLKSGTFTLGLEFVIMKFISTKPIIKEFFYVKLIFMLAIFFGFTTGKSPKDGQRPYAMLKAPVPSITVVKQH
jgi:hypothetical protein